MICARSPQGQGRHLAQVATSRTECRRPRPHGRAERVRFREGRRRGLRAGRRRRPEKALARLPHAALWLRALSRRAAGRTGAGASWRGCRTRATRWPSSDSPSPAPVPSNGWTSPASSRKRRSSAAWRGCNATSTGSTLAERRRPGARRCVSALLAAAAPMPQRKSRAAAALRPARRSRCAARARAISTAAVAMAAGNHLARWLATLPPNELDCVALPRGAAASSRAAKAGRSGSTTSARSQRLGAGAFLCRVARQRPSRRRHRAAALPGARPSRRGPRIALVGKGICFDTGGINLKSHKGMYLMHGDMQGSAVAVGTLLACSRTGARLDHRLLARAHRERDRAATPTARRRSCARRTASRSRSCTATPRAAWCWPTR